jgi:hypothetical protein
MGNQSTSNEKDRRQKRVEEAYLYEREWKRKQAQRKKDSFQTQINRVLRDSKGITKVRKLYSSAYQLLDNKVRYDDRFYVIHVPLSLNNITDPVPVLFYFHGKEE